MKYHFLLTPTQIQVCHYVSRTKFLVEYIQLYKILNPPAASLCKVLMHKIICNKSSMKYAVCLVASTFNTLKVLPQAKRFIKELNQGKTTARTTWKNYHSDWSVVVHWLCLEVTSIKERICTVWRGC